MILKPFDAGNWFPINNAVFDYIMQRLSPNAFKVLCVAIRHTWGWKITGNKRKESDVISYRQFQQMTGITSFTTIHDAIMECLDKEMLLRTQVPASKGGSQKQSFSYRLNIDYEIISATETVVDATTETVVASTTETVASKETKKQTHVVDDNSSEQITSLLIQAGVDATVAKTLTATVDIKMVQGWLAYCQKQGEKLNDPAAFLVSRLRKGEPAPTLTSQKSKEQDRRRYITGKYADLIQH